MCQTNAACANFPIGPPEAQDTTDSGPNMTCYQNGATVRQNHQMCNVTSKTLQSMAHFPCLIHAMLDRKILDMLPDRPPQVTFSCDKPSLTCQFQFWIGHIESFYCALDTCETGIETGYDKNVTKYGCQNMKCNCIPGRMLCGEEGSIGACV